MSCILSMGVEKKKKYENDRDLKKDNFEVLFGVSVEKRWLRGLKRQIVNLLSDFIVGSNPALFTINEIYFILVFYLFRSIA